MTLEVWIPADAPAHARNRLAALARLHDYPPPGGWSPEGSPPEGSPPSRVRADVLVVTDTDTALAALPNLTGLRLVQTLSAGVDAIVERLPAGPILCNASGVHDIGVTEWIVMAILASFRRLPTLVDAQRAGHWAKLNPGSVAAGDQEQTRGDELNGSTVVVLGYGSIGRALEDRLRPFGATVVPVARRPRPGVHGLDELPELLPAADVVVVLVPLTPATRGLVGADLLGRMKRGALLVNAARGPIVDADALLDALQAGRLRAALDVTDPEPLPDGHPLWSAPGVLITPHVAGDVRGEQARAWAFVADQLGRLDRGEELLNVVEEGY